MRTGFSDRREFIVAQHPLDHTAASFWQMCWEQGSHLVAVLAPLDPQECRPFWAAEAGAAVMFDGGGGGGCGGGRGRMKVSTLDLVENDTWTAYRLSLEHYPTSPHSSSPPTSRQTWLLHSPSWPALSPLSAAFDLVRAAEEEHQALGGPIVAVDRCAKGQRGWGGGEIQCAP